MTITLLVAQPGCSAPAVGLPVDQSATYATDAGTVPTPQVDAVPELYPYKFVPVRGIALQAETVIITINGTGNPLPQAVNLLDESYCAEVPLPEPADYDIAVVSIGPGAGASRRSPMAGHVKFTYDPMAPDQPITGCHGERLSR
jgi:hypothetical protein